ncbi:MAG: hypothetical protein ACREHD_01585 [Pirellulales bacterium]
MKSIGHKILRGLWNRLAPMRHRIGVRLDRRLDRHVELWLARTEPLRAEQQKATVDLLLVADALVRELARLQTQVDGLAQAIADQNSAAPTRLSLAPRDAA